jgi:hypothetical protein
MRRATIDATWVFICHVIPEKTKRRPASRSNDRIRGRRCPEVFVSAVYEAAADLR